MANNRNKHNLSIGDKFLVLARAFSNPGYRTKQKRSPLTPIRAAVLVKIVERFNLDRGYSYTSERSMAHELGCSQGAIHKALQWWIGEGVIALAAPTKANRVSKYTILTPDASSNEKNHTDYPDKSNRTDFTYNETQTDSAHESTHKGNNGTQVKLKETRRSRSGHSPAGAGPARGRGSKNPLDYIRR